MGKKRKIGRASSPFLDTEMMDQKLCQENISSERQKNVPNCCTARDAPFCRLLTSCS